MSADNQVIAAKQSGKNTLQRAGAYVRAHWKELLALALAAIPAFFIILHSGARKTAQSILTLPPLGAASSPGGADASNAISTPPVITSPATSTTSSPTPAATGTSVKGSNPRKVAAPALKNSASVARTTGAIAKKTPPAPPPAPPRKTPPRPKSQVVNQVLHLTGRQGGNVAPE